MKKFSNWILFVVILMGLVACDLLPEDSKPPPGAQPKAASGVKKASVKVKTQASGLTMEQEGIAARYEEDNKPGAIKHMYVISAMTGDVILYSTVKGKVISSGKRLTPYQVLAAQGSDGGQYGTDYRPKGVRVKIGLNTYLTPEVLQDDGTYGNSIPYLYWWDTKGIFHKHYVSGGQIVHISSQPMVVPKIIINLEAETTVKKAPVKPKQIPPLSIEGDTGQSK